MKKYREVLTTEQREELSLMISTGKASARELTHARILLKADQGQVGPAWSDKQIQEALDISAVTVARVRKRCAQVGVQEAIVPASVQRVRQHRLDGTQEAYLIALACSQPPDGYTRWTLRLLAQQLVELGYVETVSHETVRQVLLVNDLKPWIKKQWCIPTRADAEFVYHMEDVLEVYTRPYSPRRPQVCMDEVNTQLLSETREPFPMEPGKPKREDYEYERQGICNVFLACESLSGKRFTMVATRRTKQEWAEFVRRLPDKCYPDAEKIILVMDNLNTHTLAALYEVFPIVKARHLCQRFEVHYTPKHASWLNMAEIELSALDRQCLSQRFASPEVAERHIAAWTTRRNQQQTTIQWRFTAEDASIRLKHLYPSIKD
ncbi:IS630 family transposase [Ktedonospora formicarum]|uniref:IS630 family transposase n=1 Tax=Ktedonospora formicarum TaxID=2778364 RepID=UPI001C693FE7|nr:IS630 family transposase [Ktedonospora formicarum]